MLILVVGATGNLGQKLITSLLARNHKVRVLARSPSKLPSSVHSQLESFVQSSSYYDIPALDKACQGVDAVICAYLGIPELQIEGQLLLLRAAERAGVKTFVAASWNMDWRNMKLGDHESYDPYISFRHHVEMTSDIKPIYIFIGVMAEVLFGMPGHGWFTPANHGVWDPEHKTMDIWGTGEEIWHWTTEQDVANLTAAVVERKDASQGGYWTACSGADTLSDLAAAYERVRDCKVDVRMKGTVDELRSEALKARKNGSAKQFYHYIGWFYQLYTVDGTWTLGHLDNEKLGIKTTAFDQFLRENPEI